LLQLSGSVGLQVGTQDVVLANPDASTISTDVFSLGGANLTATMGPANGAGLDLTNLSGAISFHAAKPNTTVDGIALDNARWLGLDAEIGGVAVRGIDGIEVSVTDMDLEANQVFGLPSDVDSDAYVIDYDKKNLSIPVSSSSSRTLDLTVRSARCYALRHIGSHDQGSIECFRQHGICCWL